MRSVLDPLSGYLEVQSWSAGAFASVRQAPREYWQAAVPLGSAAMLSQGRLQVLGVERPSPGLLALILVDLPFRR